MADLNAAATLQQADDFDASYTGATITILEGVTPLAVHTVTGWATSNVINDGLATADPIADATILANATADNAIMQSGALAWNLTLGTSGSGAEVIVSTTTYIAGETSSINSANITFPA